MKTYFLVFLLALLIGFVYAKEEPYDPCKALTHDRIICNNVPKCVFEDSLNKCVLNKPANP